MFALAATVGDREGALTRKLESLLPHVTDRFDAIAVQATTLTHRDVVAALEEAGATVRLEEPDAGRIGLHRRRAVELAMSSSEAGRIAYFDLDHLLRWIENDEAELDEILSRSEQWDCTVIGRGPLSFAKLPERLAATERIVNHIYELATGSRWDLMMAVRSLSRSAAASIVERCAVETIGNDVAWPLHCEGEGLSVGYLEAEGLTYRTNVDYAEGFEDSKDRDPRAWATRVYLAAQQVDAMLPYIETKRLPPSY